ncbi:MAG: glycosyl hydrolase, partial [Flavobacteriales bacterium]
ISWDRGENWVKCNSPEVGQFYAIEVDNADPYRIYGGLQDNGTWRGPSTYRNTPGWHQSGHYAWTSIGGGDGMQIEVDPRNPEVVFSGSQFGYYSRQDLDAENYTGIHPQHALGEKPLRWNWQTPIWLSRHQNDILYMASNRVHRSFDQGANWETLSSDLTRGGIPGNVPFGTITSLHESPLRFGQLAVGTDDGLIHVSRDGGYSWNALTSPVPQDPKNDRTLWVSEVVWSAHNANRLYVALNGYRLDHFESYVFATENDGRTWTRLGDRSDANGIPAEPVNAIAESADWAEALFVGTDGGCYASLDRGKTWSTLHTDLPRVPVHDLVIQERENELVIGTHGRSIWVADLNPWLDHADESVADAWTTDTLVTLTWNEGWGEKGWAWSEPRTVEIAFSAFAPEAVSGQWQWVDSTGHTQAVDAIGEVAKGWQTLSVPAQWTVDGSMAFPELGTYQLQFRRENGVTDEGPRVVVEEEDE